MKYKKITIFTRQLSTLLRSGVPILRALEIVASQIDDKGFTRIVEHIHSDVKEGQSLSSALSKYPRLFSSFYVFMVRAGEDSGTSDKVLLRIAGHRQDQQEILSKIKTALAYPLVMFSVGVGTVIFMLTFVMPRLMRHLLDHASSAG